VGLDEGVEPAGVVGRRAGRRGGGGPLDADERLGHAGLRAVGEREPRLVDDARVAVRVEARREDAVDARGGLELAPRELVREAAGRVGLAAEREEVARRLGGERVGRARPRRRPSRPRPARPGSAPLPAATRAARLAVGRATIARGARDGRTRITPRVAPRVAVAASTSAAAPRPMSSTSPGAQSPAAAAAPAKGASQRAAVSTARRRCCWPRSAARSR